MMLEFFPQISASIKRYDSGAIVDHRWEPGTPTVIHITVVPPQPASGRDLQMLRDGDREFTHKKVWTTADLQRKDVLTINGRDYLVVLIQNYEESCEGWEMDGFHRALIREVQ